MGSGNGTADPIRVSRPGRPASILSAIGMTSAVGRPVAAPRLAFTFGAHPRNQMIWRTVSHPPPTTTRDFTATTFVVRDKSTLLLWHNKIGAWFPPGGHIDPNELPEEAALREVAEESGLKVELVTTGTVAGTMGHVRLLHSPVCILLEDIEPGHQHIDLIYFARTIDDRAPSLNLREAARLRWCTWEELGADDIAQDIRVLGRQAIEIVSGARDT